METERLSIRRFSPEDWQDLHEYLSQENVVKFEPYGVFTQEECRQEAARRAGDPSFWAVYLKDCGKLIGNVYLAKGEFDTWELGFVFGERYQGKGYATEAARALVSDVFQSKNAHRVVAMVNPLNTASWRLLERLGMRREGYLMQNIFFHRDEEGQPLWQDTYAYAMLAEEWEGRVERR